MRAVGALAAALPLTGGRAAAFAAGLRAAGFFGAGLAPVFAPAARGAGLAAGLRAVGRPDLAATLRAAGFFAGGLARFFAAGFFGAGLDLAGDFRTGFASFLAMVILTVGALRRP